MLSSNLSDFCGVYVGNFAVVFYQSQNGSYRVSSKSLIRITLRKVLDFVTTEREEKQLVELLLMEEILRQLGCIKPCK